MSVLGTGGHRGFLCLQCEWLQPPQCPTCSVNGLGRSLVAWIGVDRLVASVQGVAVFTTFSVPCQDTLVMLILPPRGL